MLETALEGIFQEVVTGVFFGARVCAEFGGREDELPGPFTRGVGVFAGEGFGHVDLADAGDEVLAVFFTQGGEVGLERGSRALGSGTRRCLPPLASWMAMVPWPKSGCGDGGDRRRRLQPRRERPWRGGHLALELKKIQTGSSQSVSLWG